MPASVDPALPPPLLGDSLMPRLARWCGCEDTPSRKAFIILTAARSALSSRFRSVEKRDHVSDEVTPIFDCRPASRNVHHVGYVVYEL